MKLLNINSAAKLFIILASFSASNLFAGEPFMLISEDEYQLQNNQKHVQGKNIKFKTKSFFDIDQNIPIITINSPLVTSGLYSPIKIEIYFKASDDANIQLGTLKVLYGWLKLDITDRIKQHAHISYTGISADNVMLPVGEHNITIQIMDTKNRSAEKKVSFEILKPENR